MLIVVKPQDVDGCRKFMSTNMVIEELLFVWFILHLWNMIDLYSLTAKDLESSQYYLRRIFFLLQNLISAKLAFNHGKTLQVWVASAWNEYDESLSITLEESDVVT